MPTSRDTIVAISSPPGVGWRGIVRLSGPRAWELATNIFTPLPPREGLGEGKRTNINPHPHPPLSQEGREIPTPRIFLPGKLSLPSPFGKITLPARLLYFPAPHSYTGEDVVELHIFSNPALLRHLARTLAELGVRPAEAGEFTRRAVLNGKLDLTRAEGVSAVISAQNDAELRAGQSLLAGHLSDRIHHAQARLRETLALLEAGIDFVDEGITFLPPGDLASQVRAVQWVLTELLSQPAAEERSVTLPRVVILGRPNAGKSTLFNVLLGRERAIASALPGTTRDVLRGHLTMPDGRTIVELFDTAGLEKEPGRDSLNAAMHAHALRAGQAADLVLLVCDLTDTAPLPNLLPVETPEQTRPPTLIVGSKWDLLPREEADRRCGALKRETGQSVYPVSAHTGTGLDALRRAIADRITADKPTVGGGQVYLLLRHRDALCQASEALQRVMDMLGPAAGRTIPDTAPEDTTGTARPASLDQPLQPELLAIELREALYHLGRVVGQTLPDDLLDVIFSRFCVGK